jgi:aspartyl-tRNA(Asn)/glutamyl-tRNA(Gln) amidotransferase subunit A
VPKSGVVPLGFSLDSVGPMARSAHDCALLLGAIAGADPTDPTTADVPVPDYLAAMGPGLAGLRVGVARPYFFDAEGLDPDVARLVLDAADVLREIGARVVDVEIPHAELAKDANVITSRSEAFANHRADLVARWHDYGRHTRPLLAQGALMNAGDYVAVQRFRSVFRRSLAAVLADVDVIVTPTMPTPAARADVVDSIASRMAAPNFMAQWNLAGVPALAVPVGAAPSGLPISMQLVGRPFAEARLLAVADAYQRATRWHLAVPALPAAGPAAA